MVRWWRIAAAVVALAMIAAPAAHSRELVTVPTAAGIDITVAPSSAAKFQGFIRDLVELRGYRPKHIGCFARGGHVTGSRHYSGNACDFDQTGWNRTARVMYRIGDLAKKWGLRNGCSFRDCGHVDVAPAQAAAAPAAARWRQAQAAVYPGGEQIPRKE
jgi:hypothetical protein